MGTIVIEPVGVDQLDLLAEHMARHRQESGRGEHHFMPFPPGDPDGPRGRKPDVLKRPLDQPGWERVFGAFTAERTRLVGHVDLTGDSVRSGLHRCELGIGIERPFRGVGLGRRLMETAIAFAREASSIAWLDLKVFAHNHAARELYLALGFQEIGTVIDRFRIEGISIDDVMMTLDVQSGPAGP